MCDFSLVLLFVWFVSQFLLLLYSNQRLGTIVWYSLGFVKMKTFAILAASALLSPVLANPEWAHNPPTLNPRLPIYLASVFYPPQMHIGIYVPPRTPEELHDLGEISWCYDAIDVSDNVATGSRTPSFNFEGIDGLKIHDFYSDMAYISRHGMRFANCFVGPQSGPIGFCDGRKSLGQKFIGVGHRVWSCYVLNTPDRKKDVLGPREDTVDFITGVGEPNHSEKTKGSSNTRAASSTAPVRETGKIGDHVVGSIPIVTNLP